MAPLQLPPVTRTLLTCILCVITGYTDVICFSQFKAFAATQTGNLIFLGISAFDPSPTMKPDEPIWRASVLVAYLVGVAVHSLLERRIPHWAATVLAPFLATLAVLCSLNGSGIYKRVVPAYWDCVALSAVFGVQTSASTKGGLRASTTAMTAHMRDFTVFLLKAAFREATKQDCLNATISCAAPLSVLLGVIVGSCVVKNQEHHKENLLLPVGPVLLVLLIVYDMLMYRMHKRKLQEEQKKEAPCTEPATTRQSTLRRSLSSDMQNLGETAVETPETQVDDVQILGEEGDYISLPPALLGRAQTFGFDLGKRQVFVGRNSSWHGVLEHAPFRG